MKFKEIKPGMVIHCPTEEDARALLEHLKELGYCWSAGKDEINSGDEQYQYYYICGETAIGWAMKTLPENPPYKVTEFSDLIEPDSSTDSSARPLDSSTEMSAVEVLEWLRDGFLKGCAGIDNRLRTAFNTISVEDILTKLSTNEIIEKITAYEAAKKEKPVEVEKGWLCQIFTYGNGNKPCIVYEQFLWGVDEDTAKEDSFDNAMRWTADHDNLTTA